MPKLLNVYQERFTVVPNEALFDKRLDFRARGLLSTIIALPNGWNFSIEGLCELVNGDKRGEGKDAVRNAVNHLETLGYLQRVQVKSSDGKFTGYDYKINIPPIT